MYKKSAHFLLIFMMFFEAKPQVADILIISKADILR